MTHHPRPLHYYLKSWRQHANLTQAELAYLLGASTGAKVSRYESGNRIPSLETSLAYEAALGVPVRQIFRGTYDQIETVVAERRRILEGRKDKAREASVAPTTSRAA